MDTSDRQFRSVRCEGLLVLLRDCLVAAWLAGMMEKAEREFRRTVEVQRDALNLKLATEQVGFPLFFCDFQ